MDDSSTGITLKRRSVDALHLDQLIEEGYDPIIARVIAGRPIAPTATGFLPALKPTLAALNNPQSLKDIEKAVERVVLAIENKEVIGLETDHDCDGQTSHAVLYCALTEYFSHPKEKVLSCIGHRLNEGYGLSEKLCNRILDSDPRPTLIITADNGSADEARIQRLKSEGIDTIVTDHHEIPLSGIPTSAVAVLNPTRPDCLYEDPYIAGCMVAWLLIAAVRATLLEKGLLADKADAPISELLDFVAVGTVADCVSIARSVNNRAVVSHGLKKIEQWKRPCWLALRPLLSTPVSVEDLGFKVGPMLNSDGRLDSALGAVSFLLAPDINEGQLWIDHLTEQNNQRKKIQKAITLKAMRSAKQQVHNGKYSICVFLEEGHPGVHGISASRVKDAFGRPTILLAPKINDSELLTGSARSVDGLHMKSVLEAVHAQDEGILVAFGGHKGAAGLTLYRERLPDFIKAFEAAVAERKDDFFMGPLLLTDGVLPESYFNVETMQQLLEGLGPFGREFEPPTFEANAHVMSCQPVGDGTHLKLTLHIGAQSIDAIWFGAREDALDTLPVQAGQKVHVAFACNINRFRGEVRFNPQILYCQPEHIHQTIL